MADNLPKPADLLPHTGIALVLDELTELEPGVTPVVCGHQAIVTLKAIT